MSSQVYHPLLILTWSNIYHDGFKTVVFLLQCFHHIYQLALRILLARALASPYLYYLSIYLSFIIYLSINISSMDSSIPIFNGLYFLWTECLCPPKLTCWNPNTHCDGIGRRSLWEVIRSWAWSPHEWSECPYQRDPRALSPSENWENTVMRWLSMNQDVCL